MEINVGTTDRGSASRQQRRSTNSSDCFLGIDLGGTKLRLLLVDSSGAELGRLSERLNERSTPKDVVDAIDRLLSLLLRQSDRDATCLVSAAAGVPGVTNVETGLVKLAPFLSGWQDVPFGDMLARRLSVPAYVDNDVNLAALGEAEAGVAIGRSDFVFLALGTGFGAGIFLRGELYRGADWCSGELGYLRICGGCDAAIEADLPGPLERVIGGPAIEHAWSREARNHQFPTDLSATAIFELAASGHPSALKLLDRTAGLLSEAIATVSLVLNCPLFVLGGGVGRSPHLYAAVQDRLSRHLVVHPSLKVSDLGHDAQLIGAVHLALGNRTRQTSNQELLRGVAK